MPEGGRRRLVAVAGAGLLAATLAAPGALAQSDEVAEPPPPGHEDRWLASAYDEPFDEPDHAVRSQPFQVAGTLRYEKAGPADHIVDAEVRIVPDDDELAEGCALPAPVVVPGPGPGPDLTAELRFEVDLDVACNGAYVLEAEGRLDDPSAPTYTLRQTVALASPPAPVTDVVADLDEDAREVTVTFTPLDEEQLDADSLGYVLERGGPADGVAEGSYVDVGAIDVDDEPRFVDDLSRAAGGTYTYRVRSLRAGAEEPERSELSDTGSATVSIGEPSAAPPTTSRATADRGPRRGGVSVTRRSPSTTRRVTVTTLDTGFEDTIDYDGVPPPSTSTTEDPSGDEPLAGQSIIQDEGEDVDLAAPVAGALVLLGWAGHIAYLNRLAKQLSPGP